MKEGRGGGKERDAPTHLIENSKLTHVARVTKNNGGSSQTSNRKLARMLRSQTHALRKTWQRLAIAMHRYATQHSRTPQAS